MRWPGYEGPSSVGWFRVCVRGVAHAMEAGCMQRNGLGAASFAARKLQRRELEGPAADRPGNGR